MHGPSDKRPHLFLGPCTAVWQRLSQLLDVGRGTVLNDQVEMLCEDFQLVTIFVSAPNHADSPLGEALVAICRTTLIVELKSCCFTERDYDESAENDVI